ncbi:MAG UNVERIFIED_CONTAM: hypothetical protein LVQ98_08600 [Rickettsiaceae bacterium]
MSRVNKPIPNPSKLTDEELKFIKSNASSGTSKNPHVSVDMSDNKKKGYMVSMPNSFMLELKDYIKNNPTEGSMSSLIVRVVGEYIKNKRSSI